MDEPEIKALAEKILDYLETYPDAADSVEGVAHWWLRRQSLDESVKKVERALDYLYTQNKVNKKILPGGKVIWLKKSTGKD